MAPRLSPQAESELDGIWLYVARDSGSISVADRFVDSLTERLYLLAQNPFIGRSREDDLRPGLRSFPVGEYVVVYRIDDDGVYIINIVRGSRNLRALFGSQ